jgi:predicted MPP superfamily phosphohydrolase
MACGLGLPRRAFSIEPGFRLAVRRWTARLPQWPRSAPLLRIAALSDFHASWPWMTGERVGAVARAAMEQKPDLVVLLGDFVGSLHKRRLGRSLPVSEWTEPLGRLRPPLGVYAVLGNHDWWAGVDAIRAGLEDAGVRVMENEAVKIAGDGRSFWLAGLGDQLAHGRRVRGRRRGVDDLPGTLAQVTDDDPLILMAHEPDVFSRSSARVALQLSGHTHGGQVRFPFIGAPVVPSRYGQRYAYGHIVEGGRNLVVSGGVGVSGLPIRFLAPPEVTIVDVTSKESP